MNAAKRLSLTVWRSLTSTRLTVLLLAALLVALVIESSVPRFPPDSAVRALWLQPAALRYSQTTRLIQLLGCSKPSGHFGCRCWQRASF